jgi:uncharacterized membrane protein YhaH (DUF805 family)
MRQAQYSNLSDSLGLFTSAVCLVHCLALPLVALILPVLHLDHDDSTHMFLALWVLIFALLALPSAIKKENWLVVYLILTGLAAVLIATFASNMGLSHNLEAPLITVGNLLVMTGHYRNRRDACCQVATSAD